MDRREFIQLSGAYLVGGSLIMLPNEADAFWPWVARFVFRGLVRSTARSAARGAFSGALRGATIATRRSAFKSVIQMGIVGGSIVSVAPALHASISKYNAKAIWVNEGVENNFSLSISNATDKRMMAQLFYQLRDIDTGRVEIDKPCGLLSAGPNDSFEFPFSISELPFLGAKQLHAVSDSNDLLSVPSEPIIVTSQEEVSFGD